MAAVLLDRSQAVVELEACDHALYYIVKSEACMVLCWL
jgi:hypothetical protein